MQDARSVKLRDYQRRLILETREALGKYRRVIMQSPTGSGKGVLIGSMAAMSLMKGKKVLVLTHSEEILSQNANHIRKWAASAEKVTAKTKSIPSGRCVCMMAQTAQQRVKKADWLEWFCSFQFYILDECHRAEFNFVFEYISDSAFVCGLSASPVRYGSQRQLGLDYGAIVVGPSVSELISEGYLCRCRLFSLDAPSMEDVEWSSARGDYHLGQMAAKFRSRARYVGAVENYIRICKGQKCLVFCCSSEQTIEVTKAFCERGIEAKYCLSGDFDEDEDYSGERKEVVEAFARGEFPVLVNYGLFTAGIDIPDIKVVMLMFSTTSVVKYLQVLGRASRPAAEKNGEFICLDFGRNYERLGRYEDNREWSVWHNTGAGGGIPPTKICPQCGKMIPVQMMDCCFCHYHFPSSQEIYQAELQEIVAENNEETIEGYVARKKMMGWKNDWILRDICQKHPEDMKGAFMKAIDVLRTGHGEQINPQYWHFFRKHKLGRIKNESFKQPKLL